MNTSTVTVPASASHDKTGTIKCVVWDLDNTLWNGILLEDREIVIAPDIIDLLNLLDRRGILNSIASRNDHHLALEQLQKHRIADYFLYPQINWNPKSTSVKSIAQHLNLSLDSFAFIDDQEIEREEVRWTCPGVLCLSELDIPKIPHMPEFCPAVPDGDNSQRRKRYLADHERARAENEFNGPEEEFLRSIDLTLRISNAAEADLSRIEELAVRTHQLNSTGQTYSREQLREYCNSSRHKVLVASLSDRFGDYGKIGIALLECNSRVWRLRLLLVSCRVLNRGIGTIFLKFIMQLARQNGVALYADFVQTDRNRIMHITFKLAGFVEEKREDGLVVLRDSLELQAEIPDYVH